MTVQAGGVEFSVEVDSSGAVTGNSKIVESNEDLEKSFAKVDKSTKKTTSAFSGLGRNAGQAGIQVQQFFGQIQGGQSALLALSQQSADLGIVLGASGLGAAVGIAATALSFLIADSGQAETSLSRLESALESLSNTASLGANGLIEYTDELKRLAEISELAASGRVEAAIASAKTASKEASAAAVEAAQDVLELDGLFASLEGAVDSASSSMSGFLDIGVGKNYNNVVAEELAERLGVVGDEARVTGARIIEMMAATQSSLPEKALQAFTDLENRLSELGQTSSIVARNNINELINAIAPLIDKGRAAAELAIKLGEDVEDIGSATDGAAESTANLNASLQAQIIALESGAQAAEVYAATQRAIADGTEDELESVIALINKKYELINARNADAEATRQEIAAQKELDATLSRIFANGENIEAQKRERITQNLEAIRQGLLTEEQLRAEAYLTEVEQLREAYEAGIIPTQQEYDSLLEQMARGHQDELILIAENAAKKRMQIDEKERQAKLNTLSATFGNLSALMNTESRKLFEIGKAAALSGAIVDTYAAVTKTMASTPYPFNIPLAAAQAAAGFAQVQSIRNTSFGSASTGQSIQGGQVVNNVGSGVGAEPQEVTRNINVGVTGNVDISTLIEEINEAAGDGVNIRLGGG